jgi:hypothetical protein
MILDLIPVRTNAELELARAGDTLVVNGLPLDFGPLPEGARLPRTAIDCPWIVSDVVRQDGQLRLAVIVPHGVIPTPPPPDIVARLQPTRIVIDRDGQIDVPRIVFAEILE